MTNKVETSDRLHDDDVRGMIIDAASRVFQRYGLNRATMEDIAQEAGKAKSTLYYYYSSKEEIFDTIVSKEFNQLLKAAQAAAAEAEDAKEKLKKYIVACLTGMKDALNVYSIVRGEIRGNQKLLERIKTRFTGLEEGIVREMFLYGLKRHEFDFASTRELESAVKVTVGLIHAVEQYLFVENYDAEQVDLTARLIAKGL